MRKGAPFDSAEALVDWHSNQMRTRVLDNFRPSCSVLLENLKAMMEPRSVHNPDRELSKIFDVPTVTIPAGRLLGEPVEDIGEPAEWAMTEPGLFEGFTCNRETADILEAIEDPELEGEIREALAGWRASPTGRA